MFAAVFAALLSCEKSPEGTDGGNNSGGGSSSQDRIAVTPKSRTFAKEGATCDVNIVSSADWTLEVPASVDWITPSATSGKNGDRVLFTAKPNPNSEKRGPVVFTFKVGSKTATFTADQDGDKQVSDHFELVDPAQANLKVEALGNDRLVIRINTGYRDIATKLTYLNGSDWIEVGPVSEFEGSMCSILNVYKNDGGQRRATLEFTAKGKKIQVNITQEGATTSPEQGSPALDFANPEHRNMTVDKASWGYMVPLNTTIPDANLKLLVEYIDGDGWVHFAAGGAIAGKQFGFAVFENTTGADRKAKIVVKVVDGSAPDLIMNLTQRG